MENQFTMFEALQRCKNRGIKINTVIDIGASDGRWSRKCMESYPSANYFLVEAQEPHKPGLDLLVKENEKVQYILAAAGNKQGELFFHNNSLFGGVASENPFSNNCIVVPSTRIDDEIEKRNLPGPYLLKLDTHGFEVPILEGAMETIKRSELIIIEAYNHSFNPICLTFYQLCNYMYKLGFATIEIADLMLRKYDNSLWQMDIFFIKKDRPELKYLGYE